MTTAAVLRQCIEYHTLCLRFLHLANTIQSANNAVLQQWHDHLCGRVPAVDVRSAHTVARDDGHCCVHLVHAAAGVLSVLLRQRAAVAQRATVAPAARRQLARLAGRADAVVPELAAAHRRGGAAADESGGEQRTAADSAADDGGGRGQRIKRPQKRGGWSSHCFTL